MTEFIARATWGHTGPPGGYGMGLVAKAVVHHTPGQDPTSYALAVWELQRILGWHLGQGWADIGYTWLVWDHYAFEGRGWGHTGAHAPGANSSSIGIAFILDGRYRLPTAIEWQAARDVMTEGQRAGAVASAYDVSGHRDHVSTDCPGDLLYNNLGLWHTWRPDTPPTPPTLPGPAAEEEDDDMPLFRERPGWRAPWPGFNGPVVAHQSGVARPTDTIVATMEVPGPDRNVLLVPASGRADDGSGNLTRLLRWGAPAVWPPGTLQPGEAGWTVLLVEQDAAGQVVVEARR